VIVVTAIFQLTVREPLTVLFGLKLKPEVSYPLSFKQPFAGFLELTHLEAYVLLEVVCEFFPVLLLVVLIVDLTFHESFSASVTLLILLKLVS